jgi:hypothetical protein
MGAPAASSASSVQCYVNRATEFGHSVLAFAAPSLPPANDTTPPAPVPGAAALAPPARKPTPEFKWIHVANTGTYKGHHQGEFTLSAETFADLVRNLRADPKYGDPKFSVGPITLDDGSKVDGACKIVQYDYEHASEMAPWEGSIPTSGAPAIGWVLDLDVRPGDDGRPQLWALSKLGEPIRRQIDADEYGSVSIAWNPAGVHWITGEPIGAVLTSVAFTNHPFIRDLMPLAAANRAAGLGPAGSVQTRAQPVEAHAGGPSQPLQGAPMTALSADLRTNLCRLYNLTPEASDGGIIRAAENAASSGNDLAGLLKALGVADPASALAAIPDLMGARAKLSDMLTQIDALMRADAVADAEVETQDVGAAFSSRRYTDPQLVHSLAAHRASVIQTEIGKLPEPDRKDAGKVRAARSAGRIVFLTHYGVPTNPAQQHLTQTFVAGPGPGGVSAQYHAPLPAPQAHPLSRLQTSQPLPGYQPQPYQPQPLQLSQHQPAPQGAVDLSAYEGNLTQRIMQHLSSVDPAFQKLDIGARVRRASEWRKANQHLINVAA